MVTYNRRASGLDSVLYMQKYAIMQPGLYKNSFNVNKTCFCFSNLLFLLFFFQLRPSAPQKNISCNLNRLRLFLSLIPATKPLTYSLIVLAKDVLFSRVYNLWD